MCHHWHKSGFCIYCGWLRCRDVNTREVIHYRRLNTFLKFMPACSDEWPFEWSPLMRKRICVSDGVQLSFDFQNTEPLANHSDPS